MGMLTDTEIEAFRDEGRIVIEPFNPENLSGTSYDLTLGPWFWRRREYRSPPDMYSGDQSERFKLVDARADGGEIVLAPLESVLAHTNEVAGGWDRIHTEIRATSTAGRNDITACRCAGFGDPGYVNIWTLEVQNCGQSPLRLRVGSIIAQIVFRTVLAKPRRVYGREIGRYAQSLSLEKADEIRAAWRPENMLPKPVKVRDDWRGLWSDR
jgi:dCTP deaminase